MNTDKESAVDNVETSLAEIIRSSPAFVSKGDVDVKREPDDTGPDLIAAAGARCADFIRRSGQECAMRVIEAAEARLADAERGLQEAKAWAEQHHASTEHRAREIEEKAALDAMFAANTESNRTLMSAAAKPTNGRGT